MAMHMAKIIECASPVVPGGCDPILAELITTVLS
jgi:hypothetical protein